MVIKMPVKIDLNNFLHDVFCDFVHETRPPKNWDKKIDTYVDKKKCDKMNWDNWRKKIN